ncbi:MAG TPA: glycosyl hydrolase [Gemmatimonadaceae bacterium]
MIGIGTLRRLGILTAALFVVPAHVARPQRAAKSAAVAWPTAGRDAKPWTRWWWLGSAVDSAGLTRELDTLAAAGFGGVEVTAIYGARGAESSFISYLSPRWTGMVAHAATEARRHGMGLDLPQGSGWRIGGPSVDPADVNAALSIWVDSVPGDFNWSRILDDRHLDAIVAVSEDGQRIRVPIDIQNNYARWHSPAGRRWWIYVAGTRFSGDAVKRPTPGGEGKAIDPFSAGATDRYPAMFEQKTAGWPRGAIRSYFHDSFEYTGDGSRELFAYFQAHREYDLADELPALLGRGDTEHVARVQSDYRQTLDEMLREHFVERLTSWSHARGALMREQAHGSPANLLDLYAAADIPETEIFGPLGSPDADPLINKFASSAAHVAGRRLASAESFTWLGEHFTGTLADMKQAADRMFLAGINHLVYHGTAYSPAAAAWPGWQFYASMELNPRNAIWRDLPAFNRYVARVQSLMQEGEADGDVLLYWPVWDNWHDASRKRMDFRVHDPLWFHGKPFGQVARALNDYGLATDYVSDRQLERDVSWSRGRVRTRGGSYVAIVVPASVHMPPATFTRLLALARAGATVAFAGQLPTDVPGAAHVQERRAELAKAQSAIVWREEERERLVEVGKLQIASVGRGRMVQGSQWAVLAFLKSAVDPLASVSGLHTLRRRVGDERRYFASSEEHMDRWVDLPDGVRSVAIMDPADGRIGLAQLRTANKRTQARLQLETGQSVILRASPRALGAPAWPYATASGAVASLRGPWRVEFLDGGPVRPTAFTSDSASSWTGRGDADADRFAGTARYSIRFDAPDSARRHRLVLGRVAESARVRLNGRDLGVLFAPPFAVETGPLRAKDNELEVEVTNLSANRVRDLDARGVQWKNFYDINFVGIDYKPFNASRWTVRMSGLVGPVTLVPIDAEPAPPKVSQR